MTNRYFIAIIPPDETLNSIQSLKIEIAEKYNSKAALRSPAHITLHMPFNLEKRKEQIFLRDLEKWQPVASSFLVKIKNFSKFEPRVIFLNVLSGNDLIQIRNMVVNYMVRKHNIFNQSEDTRPFHPHITIAYQDLNKRKFELVWNEFGNRNFESEFFCNSFWVLRREERKWVVLKEIFLS